MRLQQAGLSHWSIGIFGENNEAPPHPLIAMSGSYIHTLRYFSGFWARRATPDRVLKILAGGYFDIKRGHSALQVSLSGSLDIWAMWEYRRPPSFQTGTTRRERASRTGCGARAMLYTEGPLQALWVTLCGKQKDRHWGGQLSTGGTHCVATISSQNPLRSGRSGLMGPSS